eukprot:2892900-Prymnesium_polylepis.1
MPPSLPPLRPGTEELFIVTVIADLDLTIEAFDVAAQASYIINLAHAAGVHENNITLVVAAGSISVTARIETASLDDAQTVSSGVSTAIADGVASNTFLGVTTTSTPSSPFIAVVVKGVPQLPPAQPTPAPDPPVLRPPQLSPSP